MNAFTFLFFLHFHMMIYFYLCIFWYLCKMGLLGKDKIQHENLVTANRDENNV